MHINVYAFKLIIINTREVKGTMFLNSRVDSLACF